MSNDNGAIEFTIVPSLSFASFAPKRRTASISVIETRTSSISGMVLWKRKAMSRRIREYKYIVILWNRKNCCPIAKHLAWKDNMLLQKRTQAHGGERNLLHQLQVSPPRHAQLRDNLLGTVLRFRSRWDILEGGIWKPSSCAVTLDATGQQNYHGMHPVKIKRITSI